MMFDIFRERWRSLFRCFWVKITCDSPWIPEVIVQSRFPTELCLARCRVTAGR